MYRSSQSRSKSKDEPDTTSEPDVRRNAKNVPVTCPVCDAEVPTCFAAYTDREAGIWATQTRIISRHRSGGGRVTLKSDICSGSERKVDEGRRPPGTHPWA